MLYIISGASRSGKSMVAKQILNNHNIPFLPLDSVMMAFMNGVEDSGIHDKLWPDVIATKLWGFIKAFCESIIHSDIDYLIEGEAFLPSLLQELLIKYPNQIKICFLGYTEISLVAKYNDILKHATKHDWLVQESDEAIKQHIKNMISYSKTIQKECKKYNMKFFDTSSNFLSALQQAETYLIGTMT